jgi:formylglycine-generating enzyme required for sulfatase activity
MQMCPGCEWDRILDQQPQREIILDSYWIDDTEVTNSQFSQFVSETGYATTAEINGDSYVQPGGNITWADWRHPEGPGTTINNRMDHPARHISQIDATAYCRWAGRRLLTEAEWEKAAKGAGNHIFPWGGGAGSLYMNYNYDVGDTTPVGSYPAGASEYGVLDLSGNAWEWTGTYYSSDYYQVMPANNPQGPQTGEGPVIRGGSWASSADDELIYLMTAYRSWNYANFSSNLIGFRCAADYP